MTGRRVVLALAAMLALGSAPADASTREVVVPSAGARLAGTLVLPAAGGPHPGVVLLTGAGGETRDEYRAIADRFARAGLVTLVTDKRGAGASTGDPGYSYRELVADARAALAFLRRRPEVGREPLALWGLSEGGFIAPLVAAAEPEVAALAVVSASGVSGARQEHWHVQNELRAHGVAGVARRAVTRAFRLLEDAARRTAGAGTLGR